MAKSKLFRVAVEGATVDGRTIERRHLEQMAANYDPATYTARVNCEHIAGFSPTTPFNAYGSVTALSTEEVELSIGGEKKMLLGLYAEIEANDQLVAINKAGQKLFTSVEIHPNFAGTDEAYLVALAVTDSPASLGTERLQFAALSRPNIFSSAHETAFELDASHHAAEIGDAVKSGIFSAFTAFFSSKPKDDAPVPPKAANDNFDVANFANLVGDQILVAIKPSQDAIESLSTELADVKRQLSADPAPSQFHRTPASGGVGLQTDC